MTRWAKAMAPPMGAEHESGRIRGSMTALPRSGELLPLVIWYNEHKPKKIKKESMAIMPPPEALAA